VPAALVNIAPAGVSLGRCWGRVKVVLLGVWDLLFAESAEGVVGEIEAAEDDDGGEELCKVCQ
jgi:hypothetical protein